VEWQQARKPYRHFIFIKKWRHPLLCIQSDRAPNFQSFRMGKGFEDTPKVDKLGATSFGPSKKQKKQRIKLRSRYF